MKSSVDFKSLVASCSLVAPLAIQAASVSPAELAEARAWTAAKLNAVPEQKATEPGLLVVEQHKPRPFAKNNQPGAVVIVYQRQPTR